jgi:formylglycine-generating enzyme required for sulfatase activity
MGCVALVGLLSLFLLVLAWGPWWKEPELPRERVDNCLKMKFMLIPKGKYTRGAPNAGGSQHEVEITRPFYLGAHEVTVGQFRVFFEDTKHITDAERDGGWGYNPTARMFEQAKQYSWKNPGWTQDDNHSVVNISWNDAAAFCKWLSDKEGKTYELPREAEWEYACRAGTSQRFWHGDDDAGLKDVANIADEALKKVLNDALQRTWGFGNWDDRFAFTAPVRTYMPNRWGLYDMHGNVWEWCSDWYDEYSKGPLKDPLKDPKGPSGGKYHVLRGGGFIGVPWTCEAAYRCPQTPYGHGNLDVGFRVVLRPEPRTR